MRVEGAYTFPGDIERVFETLTNPDALARAIPGCERFLQLGPSTTNGDINYEARLHLGQRRQPYSVSLRVKAVRRPTYLTLDLRGHGPTGMMTGSGSLDLVEQDNHTVVAYRFNFSGAEAPDSNDAQSPSASFLARATCAHLADEILAADDQATHLNEHGELVTARGRIVTRLDRGRNGLQPLPWTERAIWMTAGLAMGLSAIALTFGIVRRLGGQDDNVSDVR